MKKIGVYIHIPFCNGKCPYCDFYSVKTNDSAIEEYTEKLVQKIASLNGRYCADTIYFGGGTPSLLGTERIAKLLSSCRSSFGKADEVTMEVNPESAKDIDFSYLSKLGLNRVSIGLQSANDNELKLLGRSHTATDAAETVHKLQREGIDNISLDLMLGISGQTAQSLKDSIDFCAALNVSHISAYILKLEEGTLYYRRADTLDLPNEDQTCELYELAVSYLGERGFKQYEISNFAKEGFESRHNLKYWRCEEYLGLGPAAHSFIDGKRFCYGRSIKDFYSDITESDGEGGNSEEYAALSLRLCEGLSNERYRRRYGEDLPRSYFENAKKLERVGLVTVNEDTISLTPKGFLLSNSVTAEILF